MIQENVSFNSGNLSLEGRLVIPCGLKAIPGVVICHPHPLYGGSMDNNVVHAISRALTGKGIASLRFNFRGVGRSEGLHNGGKGEVEDALAAVAYLAGREEINPAGVGLVGYSFGGVIALTAGIRSDAVKALVAVSPAGIPELGLSPKSRLVICGTEDSLIPASSILQQEEKITGQETQMKYILEAKEILLIWIY